ncbi:MAG: ABC transporter ATP-binding protein [Sphaerochaeta sp.]|jgi:lipoprotein-releasing system ATP-binding protein
MMKSTDVLRLDGISKSFPATLRGGEPIHILSDITFSLAKSTALAITGNSGSGKSTLLHIAAALLKSDRGGVWLEGELLSDQSADRLSAIRSRRMGFIFQASLLLEDFTAIENVELAAMIGGLRRSQARKKAKQLLQRVGLGDRLTHRSDQLSGGEKQRVAIARALVNGPAVIYADEPTGSLDEENAAIIEEMLFSMVREEGVSMLLVTHNPLFAQRCDHVMRLSERTLEVVE